MMCMLLETTEVGMRALFKNLIECGNKLDLLCSHSIFDFSAFRVENVFAFSSEFQPVLKFVASIGVKSLTLIHMGFPPPSRFFLPCFSKTSTMSPKPI